MDKMLYILNILIFLPLAVSIFKLDKIVPKKIILLFYYCITTIFLIWGIVFIFIEGFNEEWFLFGNFGIYVSLVMATYFPIIKKYVPEKFTDVHSISKNVLRLFDIILYQVILILIVAWAVYGAILTGSNFSMDYNMVMHLMTFFSFGVIIIVFPITTIAIIESRIVKNKRDKIKKDLKIFPPNIYNYSNNNYISHYYYYVY